MLNLLTARFSVNMCKKGVKDHKYDIK